MIGRFLDFIRYPSHSRTMGILAFLVLLLAIPLTVNIAQKQQELRQRAAFEENGNNLSPGGVSCSTQSVEKCFAPELAPSNCTAGGSLDCGFAGAAAGGAAVISYVCQEQVCTTPAPTPQLPSSETPRGSCSPGYTCVSVIDSISCKGGISGVCTDIGNGFGRCCENVVPPAPANTPTPGVKCEPDLNGQCLPPNIGFGDGLTRFYDGNCDNSSYACFAKYNSAGNATVGPGGKITLKECTKDAPGGHYEYVCGSDAGCPAGQHKAAYVCPGVGTWSDPTCYSDAGTGVCSEKVTGAGPNALIDRCTPAGGRCEFSDQCRTDETEAIGVTCSQSGQICCKKNAPAGGGIGADCGDGGFCVASPPLPQCQIIPGFCQGAQQCAKKGSCNGNVGLATPVPPGIGGPAATPVPTAAPVLSRCPETGRTACQPPIDSCSNSGKQTIVYSGQNCTPQTLSDQTCTLSSIINNCNPGNQCPASGSGACVAKVQAPTTNATTLGFVIGLDGFGTTGDRKAPDKPTNITPKKTRSFFYQVFDKEGAGARELDSGSNQLSYNNGKFTASFKLNVNLPGGSYVIKVRPVGYLSKIIRNVNSTGTDATTSEVAALATGDVNADNHITVEDYTILKDCMFKAATGAACQAADLDDSGKVDQFDYNLFLREIAVVQDGE